MFRRERVVGRLVRVVDARFHVFGSEQTDVLNIWPSRAPEMVEYPPPIESEFSKINPTDAEGYFSFLLLFFSTKCFAGP
jgi:hypothetical protein